MPSGDELVERMLDALEESRREVPWYAHPVRPATPEEQVAWRRAVQEVADICDERLPDALPNENCFACACGEPTREVRCALCLDDLRERTGCCGLRGAP